MNRFLLERPAVESDEIVAKKKKPLKKKIKLNRSEGGKKKLIGGIRCTILLLLTQFKFIILYITLRPFGFLTLWCLVCTQHNYANLAFRREKYYFSPWPLMMIWSSGGCLENLSLKSNNICSHDRVWLDQCLRYKISLSWSIWRLNSMTFLTLYGLPNLVLNFVTMFFAVICVICVLTLIVHL